MATLVRIELVKFNINSNTDRQTYCDGDGELVFVLVFSRIVFNHSDPLRPIFHHLLGLPLPCSRSVQFRVLARDVSKPLDLILCTHTQTHSHTYIKSDVVNPYFVYFHDFFFVFLCVDCRAAQQFKHKITPRR